jgi:hypothetical protein
MRSAPSFRVRHQPQPRALGGREHLREPLGRSALFAAADPQRHHAAVHALRRQFRNLLGLLHAELPHGVQYPTHFHRRSHCGLPDGVENRPELLPLPQHHAGRQSDFGVAHVFGRQPLQQPPRNQRVILGRAQPFSHRAERFEKVLEIRVAVERAEFFERRRGVEFMERFGLDRTLQMQVQLGFGHFHQEIGHT